MSEIETLGQAINPVVEQINKNLQNDRVIKIYSVNKGRHKMLRTDGDLGYHLIFKRKPFMSFGKIFDDFDGMGESINKSVVEEAVKKNVDNFVIVYGDGKVYVINPTEFKDFAEKNDTIRETSTGEVTMSVPINMLRRWK